MFTFSALKVYTLTVGMLSFTTINILFELFVEMYSNVYSWLEVLRSTTQTQDFKNINASPAH